MRIIRASQNGQIFQARLDGDKVYPVIGDLFGEHAFGPALADMSGIRYLAPVIPPNIIAIGLNYRQHANESSMKLPERPLIFIKATSSLAGDGDTILLPLMAPDSVDYECELTVVIGKKAKNVPVDQALDYVFGYTIGNDVSARDCQLKLDTQWARGKSFDTFCPIGPWIETELAIDQLAIRTRLNGQVVQDAHTSDMIFGVRELISYCSRNMTLLPGTIIMTGTPEGVGFARNPPLFLREGDVVEAEVEGIGILRNTVARET
jgi:2-keto-4-pentenoate hydratase/2-oxohepta-3-ene-1,7-dioic acid hydratase in catechol pathway